MSNQLPDREWLEGSKLGPPNSDATDEAAENMVMIDRQELADLRRRLRDCEGVGVERGVEIDDLRRQLSEAQESLQAAVELTQIREEQLREELKRVADMTAEMDAIRYAAHMPDDYQYGLPSWINQKLYVRLLELTDKDGGPIRRTEDTERMRRQQQEIATLQQALDQCEGRYREPLTLELRREFLALPMHWRRRLMGAQADALVAREEAEQAEEGRKQAVDVAAHRAVMIASLQGECAVMRDALSPLVYLLPDDVADSAPVLYDRDRWGNYAVIVDAGQIRKVEDALATDAGKAMLAEVERLQNGINAVAGLIAESDGVYGLHRNGDNAPWSELRTGGQFEDWLKEFDAALQPEKGGEA